MSAGAEDAVMVAKPWQAVEADEWTWHADVQQVVRSLSSKGCEGLLRQRLCNEYRVSSGMTKVE